MDPNERFLEAYAARVERVREALEDGCPPTILRIAEAIVLRGDGARRSELLEDAERRALRDACHVPAWMALFAEPPAPEALAGLRREIARLRERTPGGAAQTLLDRCERALQPRTWAADHGWREFREGVREPIAACIERAAELEVRAIDGATRRHLRALGDRASSAHFVVCAGHQPRYRELTKQVFAALLAEDPGPGAQGERRLLYAENCDDETEALDLLARQLVDRELGERLWRDPFVLQRDLLGAAAQRAITGLRDGTRCPAPRAGQRR